MGNHLVGAQMRTNKYQAGHYTEQGRVVYDRPPHRFTMKDALRVTLSALLNLLEEETLQAFLDQLVDLIVFILDRTYAVTKSPFLAALSLLITSAWRYIRLGVAVDFVLTDTGERPSQSV